MVIFMNKLSVSFKAKFRSKHIHILLSITISVTYLSTDAPVVLTFPHFLDTAEEYTSLVEGLNPDPELHKTMVILEPVSYIILLLIRSGIN